MKNLASPIENIKSYYTVVVIGSGYGGGVTASRMARAGQEVCVLERGKEFLPGEFPDTVMEAGAEFQVNAKDVQLGCETGLYDLRINDDISVLQGCGLGGTSLINANVVIEADPRVFDNPVWPDKFLEDRDTKLKAGFRKAREMLAATPYPENKQGYPALKKIEAFRKSGAYMDQPTNLTHIAVNFVEHDSGINHVGVEQTPCNLCGDCCSGCNYTAKNTTQMTYLPDAKNHGAEIFTQTKVNYIARKNDQWVVYYSVADNGSDKFGAPDQFVLADVVVVSAGALGSSEIMLRSKQKGLTVSDRVGNRFTGNADVLGFAYNTDQEINAIGRGAKPVDPENPVGPCITTIIDTRPTSENYQDGLSIEEGVIPGALAPLLPSAFSAVSKLTGKDTDGGLEDYLNEKSRQLQTWLQGPYHGALDNTLTSLVMGHDGASGKLYLDDDHVRISWPGLGEQEIFKKIEKNLINATDALGGIFIRNPVSHPLMGNDQITVHPMGGCCMAIDAASGVVNHKGQVFSSTTGMDVYDSLYIADGSIMPTSLGTNPLLTISAISERNAELMAEDRGWNYSVDLPSKPADSNERELKPGIQFTETMTGYFSADEIANYEAGYEKGIIEDSPFEFTLTVISEDVKAMLEDENHQAAMYGTVTAQKLSLTPLTVSQGVFNLCVKDTENVDTRRMNYNMKLTADNGDEFYMEGHKIIHDDPGFDPWEDTTTLYITLSSKPNNDGDMLGKGILKILPANFAKQLTTVKVPNASSKAEQLNYVARFGSFFAGQMFNTYGGVVSGLQYFSTDQPPRKKRPLAVPVPKVFSVVTEDDVTIRLTRYQGGDKGPVILSHGLGVSSKIFSTDTIDTNLLEYLIANHYDVWLLDYRVSIELPASKYSCTADDIAKYDYPAAIEKVLTVTGKVSVQMVVHCFGATTWTMSMLGGYLKNVRSAVVSQISTHIKVPLLSKIKTGLYVPEFLDKLGIDSLTAYVDKESDWESKILDKALKLYPIQKEEQCKNPVCRRITFLYGQLYEHDQLNEITHENLHEMYGVANMESLEHLAEMTRQGRIVDKDGNNIYLIHLERLKLPISFIVGEENECFLPESLKLTYKAVSEKNGSDLYEMNVIPNYGHIDCIHGKNASRDVYPHILSHLEKYV